MGPLEAFIHYENLILFKKQLAAPETSDERRQLLLRLLAEEEAKGRLDVHSDCRSPHIE
ncbi:hypothetical protein [Bradyrhizobium sp. 930_D9_N1_4]|uniref:hypothetical protein n=1 Tax=Bradyrhizobium sp. 930_D9_N1_4 TaxID=3240374 RepID=UPI003F8C7AE3